MNQGNRRWHHEHRISGGRLLSSSKGLHLPVEYPFRTMYDVTLTKRPIMLRRPMCAMLLLAVAVPALFAASQAGSPNKNETEPKVLTAPEVAKLLPDAVFFRGQSASIQARNSGGVQFAKDALLLISLVDTAGYSSSLQEKYQAYLITETAIDIEGHRLEPGAYGCGFLAGNTFVVMDIGGHDLFSARSSKDADLRRPTPLQVLPSPGGAGYRLYVGRDFVTFALAAAAVRSPRP
jgi:hypothetical protein